MAKKNFDSFLNTNIGECRHFKWREALYLPRWDIHALPDEDIAMNIMATAYKMEAIRNIFGKPIIVTSWYRPNEYNLQIGGAKNSYHLQGLACDFYIKGYRSDSVRELLLDFLSRLDIRMEDLPGANWVHIDLGDVVNSRFFKP